MAQPFNLAQSVLGGAGRRGATPAVMGADFELSYPRLAGIAASMALHLQARGVGRGQLVAIRSDDLIVVLGSVLAAGLLGCRWVYARREVLASPRIVPDLVLDTLPTGRAPIADAVHVDESWARPPEGTDRTRPPVFPGYADPDDIWIISSTSGTTGTPKFVGLSHRILWARNQANAEMFDRPGKRIVGLFPPSSPAYLTRCLSALAYGGTIVESGDPDVWVAKGVDLVVGSPAQVRSCLVGHRLACRLPEIRLSGGMVPDALTRELFGSFEQVSSGYGSVETHQTLLNIKSQEPDGSIRTRTRLRAAQVEVVDAQGQPMPAGREGIVRVRNQYLAPGYLDAPELQAKAFRDGWFYPGDLGLWTEAGEFVVTGRVNDQFNLGGVKINAALMDYTLQNVPGIRDAICFLVPREGREDRLTALLVVEPETDTTQVQADARVALMQLGGREAVPEKFLLADSLPRNDNGKPDRRACVELVKSWRGRGRSGAGARTQPG